MKEHISKCITDNQCKNKVENKNEFFKDVVNNDNFIDLEFYFNTSTIKLSFLKVIYKNYDIELYELYEITTKLFNYLYNVIGYDVKLFLVTNEDNSIVKRQIFLDKIFDKDVDNTINYYLLSLEIRDYISDNIIEKLDKFKSGEYDIEYYINKLGNIFKKYIKHDYSDELITVIIYYFLFSVFILEKFNLIINELVEYVIW